MELIPVFSLIVLVATIGTFILAVGAYIMFKVREARSRPGQQRAATSYEADIFAPQPVEAPAPDRPGSFLKRDLPRDSRVRQFQSDPVSSGIDPATGERSNVR
jgi:hypothetical protein